MPEKNTITKQDLLEALDNAKQEIKNDMKLWLGVGLGVFVALVIALGFLVWEVAKDTNLHSTQIQQLQNQHAVVHP